MKRITREKIAELSLKEQSQLKACMNHFMNTMRLRAKAERKIESGDEDDNQAIINNANR